MSWGFIHPGRGVCWVWMEASSLVSHHSGEPLPPMAEKGVHATRKGPASRGRGGEDELTAEPEAKSPTWLLTALASPQPSAPWHLDLSQREGREVGGWPGARVACIPASLVASEPGSLICCSPPPWPALKSGPCLVLPAYPFSSSEAFLGHPNPGTSVVKVSFIPPVRSPPCVSKLYGKLIHCVTSLDVGHDLKIVACMGLSH